MFDFIWNEVLYRPLFNILIWLYNNVTAQDLGWAIVLLTIALRFLMLPLSIISQYNRLRNEELQREIDRASEQFKYDAVLRKEEVRKLVRARKVRPWAKTLGLLLQLLVLILLYKVFWQGITGEKLITLLYDWVDFPGSIDPMFYGFNLGATHDIVWSGLVAIFLLFGIYLDFRRSDAVPTKGDLFYFIAFPLAVFYVLWLLPMVKSLFVLTSIVFSAIVNRLLHAMIATKKPPDSAKNTTNS